MEAEHIMQVRFPATVTYNQHLKTDWEVRSDSYTLSETGAQDRRLVCMLNAILTSESRLL